MLIGLTGGIGSGKSYVASVLKSLGAVVLDADVIAHKALLKGTSVYCRVVKKFGKGILDINGQIDRKKLGRLVFTSPSRLNSLDRIIHPYVIRRINILAARSGGNKAVVIDAPLLIEAGMRRAVEQLIVVYASKKVRIERLKKAGMLSTGEIALRMRSQMPLKEKVRMADYVIDNNGTRRETKMQIINTWRKIWK